MSAELVDRIAALLGDVPNARDEATQLAVAANHDADRALALAAERKAGTPLPYLTGRQPFMGVELFIAKGALIPRAETELLGNTAVSILSEMNLNTPRVIDMCCGSGNLACGIATHVPNAKVWASDLTPEAVAVAKQNVQKLSLDGRVNVFCADLFAGFSDEGLAESIDVIVCNPPYISTGKLGADRAELLVHEPREAFDGGPYGLTIHQRVLKDALTFLRPGGTLMFEMGVGQQKQLSLLFDRTRMYEAIEWRNDEAGQPRVAVGRKKAS